MICDFPPSRAIVNIYKREKRASEYLRKYLENILQVSIIVHSKASRAVFVLKKKTAVFKRKLTVFQSAKVIKNEDTLTVKRDKAD